MQEFILVSILGLLPWPDPGIWPDMSSALVTVWSNIIIQPTLSHLLDYKCVGWINSISYDVTRDSRNLQLNTITLCLECWTTGCWPSISSQLRSPLVTTVHCTHWSPHHSDVTTLASPVWWVCQPRMMSLDSCCKLENICILLDKTGAVSMTTNYKIKNINKSWICLCLEQTEMSRIGQNYDSLGHRKSKISLTSVSPFYLFRFVIMATNLNENKENTFSQNKQFTLTALRHISLVTLT